MPWKTVNGKKSEKNTPEIETLFNGMLRPDILLDIVRHFIVYESEKDTVNNVTKTVKKLAAYHQYNAVNNALESTTKARAKSKKAGIIWHTQGSGKSLTMIFYAAKLALSEKMENPTIVVLTDRNDLDGQLFGTFSRCEELLRQNPKQAESRAELTTMLNVSSGGIYFTTIQKFLSEVNSREFPKITERDNIVVISDEAHRSQYGFGLKTKITGKEENTEVALKYGYAKYLRDALPNATFIGFTGTPIETADKSTPAVFGPVVDVYDIKQSVDDGNTVKIYYENRLVEIRLKPEEMPKIDPEFDEVTEGEEEDYKEKQKTKWSTLEKVVGTDERIKRLSKDFVEHWEKRLSAMKGKAMVVAMSRRIAVQLHNEIVKLRPDWYNKEDENGEIKVVMTGSASDEPKWQEHIRNKARRDAIGDRFKDPDDPLKVVIVRDMWLTGFDVPSLNTIYIDKPMKGHTLMQAIARVNRVFKDKPGGLVVDYIGIGTDLKEAMSQYSEGDQKEAGIDVKEAIKLMLEKYEVVACMFHGFDFSHFFDAAANEKIRIMLDASDFILTSEENKKRFLTNVSALSKAYSLAVPSEESSRIRDDVGFFQAVRAAIMKNSEEGEREYRNIDTAINQIVSKSIVSDRVIDIFAAVGSENPDLSILSDTFLSEIEHMERKNLAYEALKRLLADQIRIRSKKNIIKGRSFAELLDKTVKRYIGRSIDAAKAIEELIQLAKEIREETNRGRDMGLSEDEVAFFDALADHKNAKDVLGDDTLRTIAKELVKALRKNVTIDWTIRESVQAQMRLMIRKILKKYHYPPDGEEKATDTVLDQAKRFASEWSSNI